MKLIRALAFVLSLAGVTSGYAAEEPLVLLGDGIAAWVIDGKQIELFLDPGEGETWEELLARVAVSVDEVQALKAANPQRTLPIAEGTSVVPIRVPWELVREEYRYVALRLLFPDDRLEKGAWIHEPSKGRVPTFGEGLWQVALWFTGDGENWQKLALENRLDTPELDLTRPIRIPEQLLLPRFTTKSQATVGPLDFGRDRQGAYADYRLKRGEALYSSVVARFTGLVEHDAVLEAVAVIQARSGIKQVTRLPVGQRIRIPRELIQPEWLPPDDPRAVLASLQARELEAVVLPAPRATLDGLHLVLDPGHGGEDIGTQRHNIWESDYVYDIACRIKRALESERGVTVHLLVEDRQHGCQVHDRTRLAMNRREVVMTTPHHPVDTDLGVNLRWVLANAIYRRLTAEGVDPEQIVFVSLHADSLHASLRGGMVYVPGEQFRRGSYSSDGPSFRRYREAKGSPVLRFTRAERLRDEAVSRRLAAALLHGYRAEELPIHENLPIRDRIIRSARHRRAWLPAVLRGNQIPAKVLLETVNLNNMQDAKLLEAPAGRERIARAVVTGLRHYYSEGTAKRAPERRSGR
jgi:N-acetylmuramoyl-L-alanine amidase